MKKLILLGIIITVLSSCVKITKGKQKVVSKKVHEVELIGEVDSIKVYRISTQYGLVYFTNKGAISAN